MLQEADFLRYEVHHVSGQRNIDILEALREEKELRRMDPNRLRRARAANRLRLRQLRLNEQQPHLVNRGRPRRLLPLPPQLRRPRRLPGFRARPQPRQRLIEE
ncbi:hypothetical protein QAD02_006294 [Eretmocerus hayati]|uniref:Uncharacterized protein n=1 Tax=Eretmocerus hayati TaxID=131215 RepID=A0ACC2N2T2_9HYME|nr:hypothetical protein QAD02_006294 [Eretmocerus hayati]